MEKEAKQNNYKEESVDCSKEVSMAKIKKDKRTFLFLQILRWLSLVLAILFFLWLAKNLGWLTI